MCGAGITNLALHFQAGKLSTTRISLVRIRGSYEYILKAFSLKYYKVKSVIP